MKEGGRRSFLPFFPTPSPLFYSRHFSPGLLTLVPCFLLLNGTETLATQTTGAGVGRDESLDLKVFPFMVPYLL